MYLTFTLNISYIITSIIKLTNTPNNKLFVLMITSIFVFGETIIFPPAFATSPTSSMVSTVPAPITALSPKASESLLIEIKGDGEFRGTSIKVNPVFISITPTSKTSSGSIPRRIATNGHFSNAFENEGIITFSIFYRIFCAAVHNPALVASSASQLVNWIFSVAQARE